MLRLNSPDTGVNPSSIVKRFMFHRALGDHRRRQFFEISDDCKIISDLIEHLREQFSIAESTEFSLFMENSRLRPQSSIQVLCGSSSPVIVMPTLIGMESICKSQKSPSSHAPVDNSTGERDQSSDTSKSSTDSVIDDFESSALSTILEPSTFDSAFETSEPDLEANGNRTSNSNTRHETESDILELDIQSNSSQTGTPLRPTKEVENSDFVKIVDAFSSTSIDMDSSEAEKETRKSTARFHTESDDDDFKFSLSKAKKTVGTRGSLTSSRRSRSTSDSRRRATSGSPRRSTSNNRKRSTSQIVTSKKRGSDIQYRPVNISEIETGSWIRFQRRSSASELDKKKYRRNYLVMETEPSGSFTAIALTKEGKTLVGPKSVKNPQTFKWSEVTDVELHMDDEDDES